MAGATLVGLLGTAAFVGFVHTVLGPDHYIPFIAMSKVGRWSLPKTLLITFFCGVGHVLSSIVLGFLGILAVLAAGTLDWFEGLRGDLAAWLLLGFGLAYMVWGIRRAIRNRPHTHLHVHPDGSLHRHEHMHHAEHAHPHVALERPAADDPAAAGKGAPHPVSDATGHRGDAAASRMTPWVLFTVFVLGPCEPLIPLLMCPALRHSAWGVAAVGGVYAVCTIGAMLTIVATGYYGLLRLSSSRLERYSHALAGFSLAACGGAMVAGL
jgi:ABC-type nickel/cobalt efflux system permease component RcnA